MFLELRKEGSPSNFSNSFKQKILFDCSFNLSVLDLFALDIYFKLNLHALNCIFNLASRQEFAYEKFK